ncbi:glycerophosphodiester phosphodiesterase family protein [uncultured Chitinophaga sp.]|uniref:glycerophosphodiester phosphodiesterase family protein n=1 Tax=uncultured Chitinophaga sp. TaxID=339340 RepID=UPI0025D95198|nr:glycerophosphodiester phosphodiesterase family protein [uncultured Chitinophaga sp.]
MKRILFALCLLSSSAFAQNRFTTIGKALMNPQSNTILIAAHRGAHLEAPENSMASFRHAIEMGIDIIELDVRCTKDGQLVVIHDKSVNRTTNGKGDVADLTFAQIRELKLKHNGKLTSETVPTLEEALLFAKGKIMVDLDIKTETCVDKIMEAVRKTGTIENTLFFLYDFHYAQPVRKEGFRTLVRTHSAAEVDSVAVSEAYHLDDSHYTPEVVAKIKAKGGRVWMNALGDVDKKVAAGDVTAFADLLKGGANIIQTDQPALLKAYLVKNGLYH